MSKEKYLYMKLEGHEGIAFFKNQKKIKPEHPDYKSNGGAIWIREYDPNKKAKITKELTNSDAELVTNEV